MAAHRGFSMATNVQVCFCDPGSPWQRGSRPNRADRRLSVDTRQSRGRGAVRVRAELVGTRVTRTAVDHQVRIGFTDHAPDGRIRVESEFVIETPLTLTDSSGHQAQLMPATGPSLAPALGLFAKCVTETEVTGQETLSLGFDDGTWLSIEPDPDYESWNLTGSGIDPVLVGPGGETDWQH
ncbi:hypothetical protein RKD37_008555 [Streptomyces ambofaciens]